METTPSETLTLCGSVTPGRTQIKWKIEYIEGHRIIQAKTSGRLSRGDIKRLIEEILAEGRQKNVNAFLLDQRETTLGLSVLEIDRLPEMLSEIGFGPGDKAAVLVNPDSFKNTLLKFLQDVLSLSSLQIRVVSDFEKATAWLEMKN